RPTKCARLHGGRDVTGGGLAHAVSAKTVSAGCGRRRGTGVFAHGCKRPNLSDPSGAIARRLPARRRVRRRRAHHSQSAVGAVGAAGHRRKQAWAGGHLALEVAAHASPDGYTMIWVGGAIPLYGLMIKS